MFIIFIRRFALGRIRITDLFMLNVFEFHSSVPCSLSVAFCTLLRLLTLLVSASPSPSPTYHSHSLSLCLFVFTLLAIANAIVQTLRPPTGAEYKASQGGVALCYWQLLNLIRKSEQLTYKHLPLEATQQ